MKHTKPITAERPYDERILRGVRVSMSGWIMPETVANHARVAVANIRPHFVRLEEDGVLQSRLTNLGREYAFAPGKGPSR